MFLPPLTQRSLVVLQQEHQRLTRVRGEVNETARHLGAAIAFSDILEYLDYALGEIEGEISRKQEASSSARSET